MKHIHAIRRHIWFWIFCAIFAVLNVLIIFRSGSDMCWGDKCGLMFWGSHEHDGIWHLALANISLRSWPFYLPNYVGVQLSGYNMLLDLVLVFFIWLKIPALFAYFKLLPFVWVIVFIYLSIRLADILVSRSYLFRGILLFFFMLAGSLGYVLTLYHRQMIWESSGTTAMQSIQALTNLQFAFSLCALLGVLIIIARNKIDNKSFVIVLALLFIAVGFKFYAGFIMGTMLVVYYSGVLLKDKNFKKYLMRLIGIALVAGAAFFLLYNPTGILKQGSSLVWQPMAMVNPMIEVKELFYMPRVALARYYLESTGKVGIRLIAIWLFSLGLFIWVNFGTRLFGLIPFFRRLSKRKTNLFDITVLSGIVVGVIMPVLFIQRGSWWNTIQFMYYSLFLSNIYAAYFVYDMLRNHSFTLRFFGVLIMLLSVPTSVDVINNFIIHPPTSYISRTELKALAKLKELPQGVVLVDLYNRYRLHGRTLNPAPLFAVGESSYVSAFSGKTSYFADITQLDLLSVDYLQRKELIATRSCDVLKAIDYIYHYRGERLVRGFYKIYKKTKKPWCTTPIKPIFTNKEIIIYSTK